MKIRNQIINAIIIVIVAICLITTGISAANLIGADSVQYKDTTVKAALDDLMDKVNASTCKDGALCSKVKLGDYVSMTPTSTTYTIPSSLTGYSSDQTIKPSELNLWRVIDIHEDGTIDMVSQYVSNTAVYFYGQTGYLNLVGALNAIAKQYENNKFTVGSRYMGYNGQTEYIIDISKFTYPALMTSTIDNSNEVFGGGDILYENDIELVSTALGTLAANKKYWLASRYYGYSRSTYYYWLGRYVDTSGIVKYDVSDLYKYLDGWGSGSYSHPLRPIVTLKSDINGVLGSGTSADPWVLQ